MKPGSRWASGSRTTEVIVVRPPSEAVVLECGGEPMHTPPDPSRQAKATEAAALAITLLGKRYTDPQSGLEVLCTKSGAGTLSASGRAMSVKEAKALPSSD